MKLKTLIRDTKALSPVVATIILIAVTVAVSIAVASWMSALSYAYIKAPEEIQFTNAVINTSCANLTIRNAGTSSTTVDRVYINDVDSTSRVYPSLPLTLEVGGTTTITITPTSDFVPGAKYTIKLVTAQGDRFPITIVPP